MVPLIKGLTMVLIGVSVFGAAQSASTNRTVVFGICLTLSFSDPNYYSYPYQYQSLYGFQTWVDWWNGLDSSLRTITNATSGEQTTIDIVLDYRDDHASLYEYISPDTLSCYGDLIANSSIDFLFAPIGKADSIPVAQAAYEAGRAIILGATDSSKGWYDIPITFGSAPTATKYANSVLPYWRLKGIKSVSIMVDSDVFQSEICLGLAEGARKNGITVTGIHKTKAQSFYTDYSQVVNEWFPNITAEFEQIKNENPDAFFICDYNDGAEFTISLIRASGWTPKAVGLSNLFFAPAIPSDFEYVATFSTSSPYSNYPSQKNFMDMKSFSSTYDAKYGSQKFGSVGVTASTVQSVLAGMLYTNAIIRANSIEQNDVLKALKISQLDSFAGLASFDINRRQLLDNLVLMQIDGAWRVVGPALATEHEFVYPFPPFNSRTFKQHWARWADITGLVLVCFGSAIVLTCFIWTLVYFESNVLIVSSRIFLLTVLFGAVMSLGGVIPYMPDLVSPAACILRVWLLPCGFMIMLCAIIGKLWSILRIYHGRRNKETPATCCCPIGGSLVPDKLSPQIMFYGTILFVPQLIASVLMSTLPPLKPRLTKLDAYDNTENYMTCVFTDATLVIFIINVVYGVCIVIWGVYLALKVRAIKTRHYDEGKGLSFSFYNLVFFGIVAIAIRLAVSGTNRGVSFVILSAATLAGTAVSLGSIFIGRVSVIRTKGPDAIISPGVVPNSVSDPRLSSTMKPSSTTTTSADIKGLKSVYEANKVRIYELEAELSLLKEGAPNN